MKLVTFLKNGVPTLGRVEGAELVDLSAARVPQDMVGLLSADAAVRATASAFSGPQMSLADVELCAPILRPPKILAVGLNYRDHIEETGLETPKVPLIFNKQSTAATGPYAPIHLPRVSDKLDYEGELGVVIGRRCRHVPRDRAHEVIAGYAVCNDVSVRDWQMRSQTFTMGKSFDTHSPFGPWITTSDDIPDPHALDLKTWVNDELRQNSNTRHLVFNCFDLVEHLSTAFTLEPGDLIVTGTPSGVGIGFDPKKFLSAGDRVRIEIEGLGAIENTVIAEPASTTLI
ncbi:MAG: fumarylacetoacetate hydrolase family protein [Gammaproteobacteria bacterium]|jgi:2-keto-4-pentenoate hydratase/2-oxohepta-3-ene-1,7-dioic acid hydratase in catechol pathway